MKRMFTLWFRDTDAGRKELADMVASGWRHRAYIVRNHSAPAVCWYDYTPVTIEVTVYDKTKGRRGK